MTTEIITGLFALGGAMIGGLFALLSQYVSAKKREKDYQLRKLADQVEAYWNLEKLYMEELGRCENNNAKSIQIAFRDRVEQEHGVRPEYTPSKVEKIMNNLHL